MKKYIYVFILAFGLNLIWENLHQFLYVHYKGGAITELILARAAIVDASLILGMIIFLRLFTTSGHYSWLIFVGGVLIAIILEHWALGNNRWEYKDIMPIIPLINSGLTPTIQLGLLGFIVNKVIFTKRI